MSARDPSAQAGGAAGRQPRSPASSWWRLWSIQGSWNRRHMQNLAWLVAFAPWVRSRGAAIDRGAWLRSQRGFLNTNPYLAPLLVGFVQRLEEDGESERAHRLSPGLSRTLGSLGDGLTWTGLRPAFALAAAVGALVFGAWFVLLPWMSFLALQAWFRQWALRTGYDRAFEIGATLTALPLHRATQVARAAGAALAGGLAVAVLAATPARLVVEPFAVSPRWWAVAAVIVGVGLAELTARRRVDPTWIPWTVAAVLVLMVRLFA